MILSGISGSGKSRMRKKLVSKLSSSITVCPDDIRRELLGDVSDQSDGKRIFNVARERLQDALMDGRTVIFDATNLGKARDRVVQWTKEVGNNSHAVVIGMEDSDDPDTCAARVRMDLDVGVDRAKVPEEVVYDQYERWSKMDKDDMLIVGTSDRDVEMAVKKIEAAEYDDIPF